MKINLKSWKIGAVLGSFVPFSLGATFVFDGLSSQGPLVAAMIVFISSILLLLAWATWRSASWKLQAAFGAAFLLAVASAYWVLFAEETTSCNCAVAVPLTPDQIKRLHEDADKGDPKAIDQIGYMYASGNYKGGKPNNAAAIKWWRQKAEQGSAEAQYRLAEQYEFGWDGVKRDDAEAMKWHRKAAEQGLVAAQEAISAMYYNGLGVKQDYAEAYFWELIAEKSKVDDSSDRWRTSVTQGLASKMTPGQLVEATRRAAKWKPKIEKHR